MAEKVVKSTKMPEENLSEKLKSPKPKPTEQITSPKGQQAAPEKIIIKMPKIKSPAQSSEINDNRYVVQSVAANPLKIKLKTGFGSDKVKAPLKLKVSLKECNESSGLIKKKKHKKKKQRDRSPKPEMGKPIIL